MDTGQDEQARRLNVNSATAQELDAIPGLQGHGFEIVRYRGERGQFTDLRQLEEVPGLAGKIDGSRAALRVGES
ncbi:competence ComEA-like helix-hairpin-helix protein [Sphingomonas insulae]|nr:helix-hairpin-helix domain-containing protein [Sphingomonas insulae]NIJ31376.1 competence ComEA-like helix-hairpin-helix protein [Sphingomonas insulae]